MSPCPNVFLLGLQGSNVRQELLALVQDLPSLLSEVGAGVGALSEAVELYQACVELVCQRWVWGHRCPWGSPNSTLVGRGTSQPLRLLLMSLWQLRRARGAHAAVRGEQRQHNRV